MANRNIAARYPPQPTVVPPCTGGDFREVASALTPPNLLQACAGGRWSHAPAHLAFIERFWERRCAVTAWNATASVPYNLNKNAADRISRSAAFLFLTGAICDYLTDLCGSMTNFLAAPLSKSLYPCGASSSEITVTFTALAI